MFAIDEMRGIIRMCREEGVDAFWGEGFGFRLGPPTPVAQPQPKGRAAADELISLETDEHGNPVAVINDPDLFGGAT